MSGYKAGDLAMYFAEKNKGVKQTKGGRKVAKLLSKGMDESSIPPKKNMKLFKKQPAISQEEATTMESTPGVRKGKKGKKFMSKSMDEGNMDTIVKPDFDSTLQFGSKKKKKKGSMPGLKSKPELIKFSTKTKDSEGEDEDTVMPWDRKAEESEEESQSNESKENSALKKIETDKRTVFFGNIPLNMKKSEVASIFQNFGNVESVRFRSYIPVKETTPRKFAERRKECNENVTSHMGFVVFEKMKDAENALQLNGKVVNGNHIRVDRANFSPDDKSDPECTVFVGNLPYTVSDEAMWVKFSPCGEIMFVRVIRNKATGLGKGFAYVRFKNKNSVQKALQLNHTEIANRNIRVKLCEYNRNSEKTSGNNRERFGRIKQHFQRNRQMDEGADEKPLKPRFNFKKKKNNLGISQESRKSFKKVRNAKKQEHQKNKIAAILKQSGTISKLKTTKSSM